MKKIVKNFTGFSKLYENENQDELIKKGREALEQAEDDAKKITSEDTGIVDKLKDAAKNNNNNNNILSKEVKESASNSTLSTVEGLTNLVLNLKELVIPKLPVVKGGYPEGWKISSKDNFLPGSTYKAYDMSVNSWGTGNFTSLYYKDEKGNRISFLVMPTTEEINHVRGIFVEACERTKWISFLRTTGVVSGIVLAAAGVAVILYGIYSKNQAFEEWKKSFYDKGQDYPKTLSDNPFEFGSDSNVINTDHEGSRQLGYVPDFSENPMTGYGVLGGELGKDVLAGAGGILGGVLLSLGSSKIDSDKEIMNQIASIAGLLKASLEPLGMNVSDLKTAGDITAVLTTNQN
jgi:hypothetical protein